MSVHNSVSSARAAEPLAQFRGALADHCGVEIETFDDVRLYADPVAILESLRSAARDGAILGVVARERRDDRSGDVACERRIVRVAGSLSHDPVP